MFLLNTKMKKQKQNCNLLIEKKNSTNSVSSTLSFHFDDRFHY